MRCLLLVDFIGEYEPAGHNWIVLLTTIQVDALLLFAGNAQCFFVPRGI